MTKTAHFLIGAAASGGGKTTLTTGLLRLLRDRGLRVQPYKCGPDYIDTKYHEMAAGTASVNLDLWLSSPRHVEQLYARYGTEADVCVTEGVMGLFDGYDAMQGSSAAIAEQLNLPVVLVVGAGSAAYTVAPILYGFRHFRPTVRLAGVVFNQVASERHYSFLRQACNDVGVECFGYLPRLKELEVPSRHLGLTLDAAYRFDAFASRVAEAIEKHVDVDRLLQVCSRPTAEMPAAAPASVAGKGLRIAVARDEAFNFIYRENLTRLQHWGTLSFFSPLTDAALPPADFVYLPGGYPEFFLEQLAGNVSMQRSICHYAENDGRLLAECGGMMYLCRAIRGMDGQEYPMVGLLSQVATMEGMRLHLGYRTLQVGPMAWRGHEFHYSSIAAATETLPTIARATDARGHVADTPLYRYKNTIAGYTHLYWGEMDLMKLWTL